MFLDGLKNRRTLLLIAVCCVVVCLIGVYYFYSPTESKFFPRCMFYVATGWECPGCGIQRALYALLHGEFYQAISYNPFLCLSLPYLLLAVVASFCKGRVADKVSKIVYNQYVVWGFIVLFFVWWIVRNLI